MACKRRLIDANALGIGRCNPDLLPFGNRPYVAGWNGVVNIIDSAPTVDAEEVVHGRLSDPYIDEYYGAFSDCLECGTDNILPCYYCRKCGAKMDGGARDGL